MIRVITKPLNSDTADIERFVYNHPMGNYFQSPSVYHLYLQTSNCIPIFLVSYSAANQINGVLLANLQREKGAVKGHLSSRCVVVGGPLVTNNDPSVADQLVRGLTDQVRSRAIYVEFRELFLGDSLSEVFAPAGFEAVKYYNFIVEIDGLAENKSRLNASRRRQIAKAVKSGVRIVVAENVDDVADFYAILHALYESKVKKPLPSIELFENFLNDKEHGKYFLVQHNDKIVGGIMCPIFKDTIYEWYVCGLDREYKDLYPSVLATWAPIEYAAANGLKYFDFMGAGPANREYGVRGFKSKFGGDLVSYTRFLKVNKTLLYNIGKAGLTLYSYFK